MNTIDFSRRVPVKTISADVASYHGLNTIPGYVPVRVEASVESIKAAYDAMLMAQKKEVELTAILKSAMDAARQADVAFHDTILAMKESVRGQFGPNSDEAQSIGYKKKSEYKRPRRRQALMG